MTSSTEKKLGVILQYSQMALSILISFIYTPIMLRILGQSQYGIYNLSNSIISYLSLLSLGFGASYIRFYSRYRKNNDYRGISRLNGLFLIVFFIMGGIALICGLALSLNVSVFFNDTYTSEDLRIARILMIFMSVNLALSFPTSVFTSYVTSQEKFIFQKLLNMIKTVVSPFLTLPILLLGYGSIGMVVVTTAITVLVDMANILFCVVKLKMSFDFREPDFHLLNDIAVFSLFIAVNNIVNQINWATDKVILGKVCTSTSVAVYAIGAQINSYYLSFSTAISNVFVPQVNQIVASDNCDMEKNRQLTQLFTRIGRIQFMVMMLILTGFIFFGKFFILHWAGKNYGNSYYVALFLIVPVTVPLIQNIGIEIQRAKNMHQFRSVIYLGMALLNVVISVFWAKKWGEIGAALGTAVSIVLANGIIMNVFYQKKMGIDMIYFWKEVLKLIPAMALPSIAGITMNIIGYIGLGGFVARAAAYAVIYAASIYLLGMNAFEKGLVKDALHKLLAHMKFRGGYRMF